ncbi:hypothetical protein TSAR_007119 [Trichomalopsis sarcophagae]|uniref:Uncharacterized protein n=1 Tax=Trichomalopsis sarcophagae TaxID=543379 RepID=A0A232F736_9HYME|nr:hypothetical protein TSAR_007119 [Trichomalopsis sarcophagae]
MSKRRNEEMPRGEYSSESEDGSDPGSFYDRDYDAGSDDGSGTEDDSKEENKNCDLLKFSKNIAHYLKELRRQQFITRGEYSSESEDGSDPGSFYDRDYDAGSDDGSGTEDDSKEENKNCDLLKFSKNIAHYLKELRRQQFITHLTLFTANSTQTPLIIFHSPHSRD